MVDKDSRQVAENWAPEPALQQNPVEPDEHAQDYEQLSGVDWREHKFKLSALPKYSWVSTTWSSAPRAHALGFHFLNEDSQRYVRKDVKQLKQVLQTSIVAKKAKLTTSNFSLDGGIDVPALKKLLDSKFTYSTLDLIIRLESHGKFQLRTDGPKTLIRVVYGHTQDGITPLTVGGSVVSELQGRTWVYGTKYVHWVKKVPVSSITLFQGGGISLGDTKYPETHIRPSDKSW